MKTILALILFVGSVAHAAPKALVYKGPGACEDGCAEAVFAVAKKAGLDPVYVGPKDTDPAIFQDAVIWMQPGGYASTAMKNMASKLKDNLKTFIRNGGGYVGFCAGAFVTTSIVGTTSNKGLGIFPGGTKLYGSGIDMKKITWNGSTRYLYWEGGPYLRNLPSSVERIAYYSNGAVAAARTTYGKGRVFITGLHPEAPSSWSRGMNDIDGEDHDLVNQMIAWVTEAH